MEYKKDARDLYCIIADILDEDLRRLTDAIDGIDMEILSEAVCESRENKDLSLDRIIKECVNLAIDSIPFEKEAKSVRTEYYLTENDEELSFLEDEFDPDVLKDSFTYEDGVTYSPYEGYSEDEMKMIIRYLKNSMLQLRKMVGEIDGMPETEPEYTIDEVADYMGTERSAVTSDMYRFYNRCLKKEMHCADADRYAALNTLFQYDIGMEKAREIVTWMEQHNEEIYELDGKNKDLVSRACKELGLELDFSKFLEGVYYSYLYF